MCDEPQDIDVNTTGGGHGQLATSLTCPSGRQGIVFAAPHPKGSLLRFDCPDPGPYRLEMKWADEHIPKSPVQFTAVRRLKANELQVC